MKIKKIIHQNSREFKSIYECENCGFEEVYSGYDDANYHENVVPNMKCENCGKVAPDNYKPVITQWPRGLVL